MLGNSCTSDDQERFKHTIELADQRRVPHVLFESGSDTKFLSVLVLCIWIEGREPKSLMVVPMLPRFLRHIILVVL